MSRPASAPILVAAAVLRDEIGHVLLARRPPGRPLEGLWEFPGGKVQSGEHPEHALARELHEELGVQVTIIEPLTFAVHDDAGRRVILLFYAARITAGTPRGLEGQELAWVSPVQLREYPTPPADAALLALLAVTG